MPPSRVAVNRTESLLPRSFRPGTTCPLPFPRMPSSAPQPRGAYWEPDAAGTDAFVDPGVQWGAGCRPYLLGAHTRKETVATKCHMRGDCEAEPLWGVDAQRRPRGGLSVCTGSGAPHRGSSGYPETCRARRSHPGGSSVFRAQGMQRMEGPAGGRVGTRKTLEQCRGGGTGRQAVENPGVTWGPSTRNCQQPPLHREPGQ